MSSTFKLTDDGTMDTVLKCSRCGVEERFNFDGEGDQTYDEFIDWAIDEAAEQHECTAVVEPSEIEDEDTIESVTCHGRKLDFWDEGYGPLFVYRCSICTLGVVRARTWEQAYECVIDEIMDDGDEKDAYEGLTAEQIENGEMNEGYMFRNNGIPSNPRLHSHIASEDLNGSALDALTDDLARDLEIVITAKR